MIENQYEQDFRLVSDVLEVRISAIAHAFDINNTDLYTAAVACDDARVLTILDELVANAEAELNEYDDRLRGDSPFGEHMHTLMHKAEAAADLYLLIDLRDKAKANVDLITSGEVCYPPALKTTEELLESYKDLEAKLAKMPA